MGPNARQCASVYLSRDVYSVYVSQGLYPTSEGWFGCQNKNEKKIKEFLNQIFFLLRIV